MVGTKNKTHDVGNDQTDVADGTTDGNCQPGQQGCSDINDQTHARRVHAEVHGFFFTGEQQIQIGGGCVDRACGKEKTNPEKPVDTFLKGSRKIAHQPEGHAAGVAAGYGG